MAKKKTVKKNLKTHVCFVLDSSGSMDSIKQAAIDAFNEQLATIKKSSKELDTTVSLVTFSSQAWYPTFWKIAAKDVKPLNKDNYKPDGGTAMYDGVGQAIMNLANAADVSDVDTSFLVVVISDGQENSSRQFTSFSLSNLIRSYQALGRWTFTYLGANQDLAKVQADLGLYAGNTRAFIASAGGMRSMSVTNSLDTTKYFANRASGVAATQDFCLTQQATITVPTATKKTTK